MKRFLLCLGIVISLSTSALAQVPVLVAKFPLNKVTQWDKDHNPIITIPNSLYQNQYSDPENGFRSPYLQKIGRQLGIVDKISGRIFWLDSTFAIRSIEPFESISGIWSEGYWIAWNKSIITIFRDKRNSGFTFRIRLGDQPNGIKGSPWYQSETLFFYDEKGNLHVVEKAPYPGPGEVQVGPGDIKDAAVVKALLTHDTKNRYVGLSWSDRYGLMRQGVPLRGGLYDQVWQTFMEDQRKQSGISPDKNHQLIPANWLDAANLADISDDGTLYWGGYGIYVITQKGYIVKEIRLPKAMGGSQVLPNGNIVVQDESVVGSGPQQDTFAIYQIQRTW